jgi:hypothetical protein
MGLIHHPARPVFDLLGDGVITKIDIFAHQIIKITQLIINLIVPAFAGVIVNDFKMPSSVGFSIWSMPLKHLKSQMNCEYWPARAGKV